MHSRNVTIDSWYSILISHIPILRTHEEFYLFEIQILIQKYFLRSTAGISPEILINFFCISLGIFYKWFPFFMNLSQYFSIEQSNALFWYFLSRKTLPHYPETHSPESHLPSMPLSRKSHYLECCFSECQNTLNDIAPWYW